MAADLGIADHLADVFTVFDDRIAWRQRLQRHLVTDGDVGPGRQLEVRIIRRDDAQHFGSRRQILDNDDANIVTMIMDKKLWNVQGAPPFFVMMWICREA
ncbi:MAG: hypothetical protein Q4G25_14785 [Paracoccus sp. (in: a-proteobacteria)]|nr:hypothetical protein [Paracoccus sp. (in: a-proteobacteria)]